MARRIDETINDYEKRVNETEKTRELELREARAQGRRYAPGMSFYEMNRQDNAEKRADLERRRGTWEERVNEMDLSPMQRRQLTFERLKRAPEAELRRAELGKSARVAEFKALGMKNQGATAAEFNAGAVKYKADKDVIIGQNRAEADKEIAKENMRAAEQRALMEQQGREKVATITANGRTQQETIKASGAVDRANIAAQSQEKIAMERTKAIREAAGIKANATREEAIAHIIGAAAAHMTKQQIDRIMKAYNY